MFRLIGILFVFITLMVSGERENILDVLNRYNDAFGKSNYSEIVDFFDYPVSFNLQNKTITANNKLKLRLIYKKIRGSLPDNYIYSKWDTMHVELIDSSIAVVNANFSRYKDSGHVFSSGSAQYHLRLEKNEWKIFSLTPYKNVRVLN